MIRADYVVLGASAGTWEEAVGTAAAPLLAHNVITTEYVRDIVEGVRECGPYFVLMPHVALPHARPECGAIVPALGICVLTEPVEFGSKANDPVKYLFTLSAPDPDRHVEALSELVDLLSDTAVFDMLDRAGDAGSVLEYIESHEEGGSNV